MRNSSKKIFTLLSFLALPFFTQSRLYSQNLFEEFFNSFAQESSAEPLEHQKELTVIQQTAHLNLNPHTSVYTNEAQILNSLYEGLFSYNPETSEPDAAIAVKYTTNRSQLFWTFTLRDDAFFSNGKKITSSDVKESWLTLLETQGAYYSSFLDIIKGAKEYRLKKGKRENVAIFAENDTTLSVELNTPASYFPKILCHSAFAVVSEDKTCYSGAYAVSELTDTQLVLEKNTYYHDEKNVLIPKITVLFSDDPDENAHLFNTGNAQWIDADCTVKNILQKNAVCIDPIFGTSYFLFKLGNSPYLTENVRAALLEAVPWEMLRTGSLFPAVTLIYPLAGYKSPAPLDYTNYEHAKKVIDRAKTEAGLSTEEQIELTFAIPEGESIFSAAVILKSAWEKIGVKLNILQVKDRAYFNNVSKINADLFVQTWVGDFCDPAAFLEMFRSDSTLNESNWKNEKFDSLLDTANATLNETKRLDILSRAEDMLLSNSVVIPLTHSIDLNVVNLNELSGWSANPLNIHPFKNMFFTKPKKTAEPKTIVMNRTEAK